MQVDIAQLKATNCLAVQVDGEWQVVTPDGLRMLRNGYIKKGSRIGLVLKPKGIDLRPGIRRRDRKGLEAS